MNSSGGVQAGVIASTLVLALLLNPFVYASAQEPAPTPAADPQLQNGGTTQSTPPATASPNPAAPAHDELPNSPGSLQAQSAAPTTEQPAQTPAQSPTQSQNGTREPLGTAAAKTIPTTGIAASRPAGSALAPAKQRRVRSILIRTGALVGAAAAIGVTMALSMGSPSRPPGAR